MRVTGWLLLLIMLGTGCSLLDEDTGATTTAPPTADGDEAGTADDSGAESADSEADSGGIRSGERVAWESCDDFFITECGVVEVPVDYDDPSLGTLDIAINVRRAAGEPIGYLFYNPGGPGISGVDLIDEAASFIFDRELLTNFDIIGFDPRGVGGSEPFFACGGEGEVVRELNRTEPPVDTPEEETIVADVVASCEESMGPAAGRLGTEFVVRDIDEIRKALGVDQITYYGASYGSTIGLWYSSIFPDQVRAMVVDGAPNPLLPEATQEARAADALDEWVRLEVALEEALNACTGADCPIPGDDPVAYYLEAAQKLELVVAEVDDNPSAAIFSVISALYQEADWPRLWQGLVDLNEEDDPSVLVDLALFQYGEDDVGGMNITGHVNCLDDFNVYPELTVESLVGIEAFATRFETELPLLNAASRDEADVCPFYQAIAPEPFDGELDGGGVPIVVIGNRSDPVTQYDESAELALDVMANGYLVDVEHPTHVVHPANPCVAEQVVAALVEVRVPAEQTTACPASVPEDLARADANAFCVELVVYAPTNEDDATRLNDICDLFVERVEGDGQLALLEDAFAGDSEALGELAQLHQEVSAEAAEG